MSSVNEILVRTAVAAVRKDDHIRVYETDVYGGIREAQYDGSWTGGTSNNVIATGKIGTPVAAASYELKDVRVYYVGTDNKIKEATYSSRSGWGNGNLSSRGFAVAPYSAVSALYLGGVSTLRVYGQLPNDTLQEWCWNNEEEGWVLGTNLGPVLPGTQIAATAWGTSSPHIRVYVQDTSLNIVEKCWDGNGWQVGDLRFPSTVVRAALGVTSWGDQWDNLGIRVYYSAPDNHIKEKAWGKLSGWYDGSFDQRCIPASNVAAVPLDILRIYIQNGTKETAVTEYMWTGRGWTLGTAALPPACS